MKVAEIERSYAAAECIVERGSRVRELYVIRSGEVTDVVLLALDVPLLNRLCAESQEFAFRLIRHLAQRVAAAEPQGGEPPETREGHRVLEQLAAVILGRSSSTDGPSPVSGRLCDLATDAGCSMLEAYRFVQDLLDQRVLRLADDRLTLLEPDKLRQLAPSDTA
jgi:CRP-like cAMP-binding protein